MRARVFRNGAGHWLISALLITFAFRALIPAGFMPSADRPFTLQICPDGFPAQLLLSANPHMDMAHATHQGHDAPSHNQHGASYSQHCVFGAATGVGPAPHVLIVATSLLVQPQALPTFTLTHFKAQRYSVQQARAPPFYS